jgi:hypothetical protein
MIKISIKKQEQITNQGLFPTMEEAQAWLDKHEGMGTFGQKAIFQEQDVLVAEEVRGPVQELATPAVYDNNGNELEPATYTLNPDGVISPAIYERRIVMVSPAQYEVVIEDISAQIAQEEVNKEALEFLASTDWMIVREMETGVACPAEIKQQRAAARARIVR